MLTTTKVLPQRDAFEGQRNSSGGAAPDEILLTLITKNTLLEDGPTQISGRNLSCPLSLWSMQIFMQTLTGKRIAVEARSSNTIEDVIDSAKTKIQVKEWISHDR